MSDIYDFEVKNIKGENVSLKQYEGKVLLIVNTASKCGYTPQYKGLQTLYEKFGNQGFAVLGFPCNQFGHQEPGSEDQIKSFCDINYKITFPIFGKIGVNGKTASPLYTFLKQKCPGLLGTEAIKWNFTKFLVDKTGKPVKRFASATEPDEIADKIAELL